MYTIRIYDQWRLHLGPNIEGSFANQSSLLLCSCCCQSKLSLSTFLNLILILCQGDLFLYGTETMICHLKRQGRRSGFGTFKGVRR